MLVVLGNTSEQHQTPDFVTSEHKLHPHRTHHLFSNSSTKYWFENVVGALVHGPS